MKQAVRTIGSQTEEGRLIITKIEKYEESAKRSKENSNLYAFLAGLCGTTTLISSVTSLRSDVTALGKLILVGGAFILGVAAGVEFVKANKYAHDASNDEHEIRKLEDTILNSEQYLIK